LVAGPKILSSDPAIGPADAHIESLIRNNDHAVYEVQKHHEVTGVNQACTKAPVQVGANVIKAGYNLNNGSSRTALEKGDLLVVTRVTYKLDPEGLRYKFDISAFNKNGIKMDDYPITGIVCVTTESLRTISDIMVTGTGEETLQQTMKLIYDGEAIHKK
jgi:hypothetical protein